MRLVAIATSPAQIFNIALYARSQEIPLGECLLLHVRSRQDGDNALAGDMIARYPWGRVLQVPYYDPVPKAPTPSQEVRPKAPMAISQPDGGLSDRPGAAIDRLADLARRRLSRETKARLRRFLPERLLSSGKAASAEMTAEKKDRARAELAHRRAYCTMLDRLLADLRVRPSTVVLGDYRPITFRLAMERLRTDDTEVVLVDDGAVTRHVIRFRADRDRPDEIMRHIPRLLGPDDPFVFHEPTSLTFFSIYHDLELPWGDRLIPNDFFEARSRNWNGADVDEIWIVGGNHVEANIASQTGYERNLLAVRTWFPDRRVVYFPHRREDGAKLRRLERLCRFEIRPTAFGMEDYAMSRNVRPRAILSFGSTVVDTLSRLYGGSDVKIAVVVPCGAYFTKSRRVGHVQSVARDNIASNANVVGLYAGYNHGPWLDGGRYDAAVASDRAARPTPLPFLAAGTPQKLTLETCADGLRVRETDAKGLHALMLGSFEIEDGFFGCLGLVSEGRSVFRFRVSPEDGTGDVFDVRFDCDGPGMHVNASRIGSLTLSCTVSDDRRARIVVLFRPSQAGRYTMKLVTQKSMETLSSLYVGNPSVGYLLTPFEAGRATQSLEATPSGRTLLAAVDPKGPALLVMEQGGTQRLVILANADTDGGQALRGPDGWSGPDMILIEVSVPPGASGMGVLTPVTLRRTARGIELDGTVVFPDEECSDGPVVVNGAVVPDGSEIIRGLGGDADRDAIPYALLTP